MATATDELTQNYRYRSLAVRAAALKQLTQAWSFDLDDIDGSWRKLEPAVLAITELRHRDAANLAGGYYMGHRAASGVLGTPDLQYAKFDRTQAANNLHLLGPILTKKAIAANQPNADRTALVRVAGEVTRLTLAGGRQTLLQSIMADEYADGWRRITSGKACEFCAMLAGRGAVYKEETVKFQSHGHCSCQPEPVYRSRRLAAAAPITGIDKPVFAASEADLGFSPTDTMMQGGGTLKGKSVVPQLNINTEKLEGTKAVKRKIDNPELIPEKIREEVLGIVNEVLDAHNPLFRAPRVTFSSELGSMEAPGEYNSFGIVVGKDSIVAQTRGWFKDDGWNPALGGAEAFRAFMVHENGHRTFHLGQFFTPEEHAKYQAVTRAEVLKLDTELSAQGQAGYVTKEQTQMHYPVAVHRKLLPGDETNEAFAEFTAHAYLGELAPRYAPQFNAINEMVDSVALKLSTP